MEFPGFKNGGFTKCMLVCSDRKKINHSISTKLATNVIMINFGIIEKQKRPPAYNGQGEAAGRAKVRYR